LSIDIKTKKYNTGKEVLLHFNKKHFYKSTKKLKTFKYILISIQNAKTALKSIFLCANMYCAKKLRKNIAVVAGDLQC
jgi:hypothetical protein